jgi:hypothetical protein
MHESAQLIQFFKLQNFNFLFSSAVRIVVPFMVCLMDFFLFFCCIWMDAVL